MKDLYFTVRLTVAYEVTLDDAREQLEEAVEQYFVDDGLVTDTRVMLPDEAIDQ